MQCASVFGFLHHTRESDSKLQVSPTEVLPTNKFTLSILSADPDHDPVPDPCVCPLICPDPSSGASSDQCSGYDAAHVQQT